MRVSLIGCPLKLDRAMIPSVRATERGMPRLKFQMPRQGEEILTGLFPFNRPCRVRPGVSRSSRSPLKGRTTATSCTPGRLRSGLLRVGGPFSFSFGGWFGLAVRVRVRLGWVDVGKPGASLASMSLSRPPGTLFFPTRSPQTRGSRCLLAYP